MSKAQIVDDKELAKILGITDPVILRKAANSGRIPSLRLTKKIIRFNVGDVLAALAANQQELVDK